MNFYSKILQELQDIKSSAEEECTRKLKTSRWLSFTANRSPYTAETAKRNWKQPASDVWIAPKLFLVQNAIPDQAFAKIKLRQQDRLNILLAQEADFLCVEEEKHRILDALEVDFLPEEEASMGRILLVQEVGLLLEEASFHTIDQISLQQFHSQARTVAVDLDKEGSVIFLQDTRFRHLLDPQAVRMISQRCMAQVSVLLPLGVDQEYLGESLGEGEWPAGGAGFAEVEGDSHHLQDFKVWVVVSVSAIT